MLWDAELIRLSVFTAAGTPSKHSFESIVGRPPTEIVERPQQATRNEVAEFSRGHIFLSQQPGRADLLIGLSPQSAPQDDLVSVGPYDEIKASFREVAARFLESCEGVLRVAYAPTLIASAMDRVSAYKTLSRLLPAVKIDAEKSEDLLWQINRPRQSKILETSRINRVMRWSVIQVQTLTVEFGQTAAVPVSAGPIGVRLEVDLSTAVAGPLIERANLLPIFDELTSLADEIAEKGDTP